MSCVLSCVIIRGRRPVICGWSVIGLRMFGRNSMVFLDLEYRDVFVQVTFA